MRRNHLALCFLCLIWAGSASGGDWPQFLGPNGSGTADEKGLPTRWSTTENVRWKAGLPGRGASGAVVARGRVYVTSSSGYQETRLHVLCFDASSGKQLWHRQLSATGSTTCHKLTSMAAPTPVTDGDRVFALFGTGDLVALDKDGNLLWTREIAQDYPTISNNVGMAASPVLWQDTLFLAMETAGESFALGIDKLTGKNRWKVDRNREINWTTPVVRHTAGLAEVLFQSPRELTAYDVRTGQKRWTYEATGLSTIPTPAQGNGLILVPGGDVAAIRPSDDRTPPQVAWKAPKLRSGFPSPLFYRGNFYNVNGTGIVTCVDGRDGKVLWQSPRLKGPFSASAVAADGYLYLINDAGLTSVLKLNEKPEVVMTNDLGKPVLGTPALADGAIFIRTDNELFCIAKKK